MNDVRRSPSVSQLYISSPFLSFFLPTSYLKFTYEACLRDIHGEASRWRLDFSRVSFF